jgi:hypothetical protein
MTRDEVDAWIARHVRAWRSPGTEYRDTGLLRFEGRRCAH